MDSKSIRLGILLALISLTACSQSYDKKLQSLYKNTVPAIKSSELKQKIDTKKKVVLLDTRSQEEYQVSHLPGATFIDYDDFTSSMVKGIEKDAEIIVYCTVGYRSERIGEKLQNMGFKNVHNLYGGIFQWANENGTLLNSRETPTDSVHTYSKKWSVWLTKGVKVY